MIKLIEVKGLPTVGGAIPWAQILGFINQPTNQQTNKQTEPFIALDCLAGSSVASGFKLLVL